MPDDTPAPPLAEAVAAAKRIRDANYDDQLEDGHDYFDYGFLTEDAVLVADALIALAAGREDDGEEIDETFARTLGFDGDHNLMSREVPAARTAIIYWPATTCFQLQHEAFGRNETVTLPNVATRGQLRALLHGLGLGIAAKEG